MTTQQNTEQTKSFKFENTFSYKLIYVFRLPSQYKAHMGLLKIGDTTIDTDKSFDDLSIQEAQDYANKVNNMNHANDIMTAEHQAKFDDSVRRWQDQVNGVMAQYKMRRQGGSDWSQMGAGLNGMGGNFGGGSNISARMANQL